MIPATTRRAEQQVAPSRAGDGFAARRLYRLMTLSLGMATLVEFASVLPVVIAQAAFFGVAYTTAATVLMTAPSLAAVLLFSRARLPQLRWIWRAQAVGMLLVYTGIPLALSGTHLPSATPLTWAIELEVIAGCAAGLGWRLRGALIYTVTLQCLVFGAALLATDETSHALAVGDAVRQLFFVAMFMSLCAALLRAGRILDHQVDRAVADVHASATAERRRTGRHRVEMLIHDRIIVALLAYAAGAGPERSAAEAKAALAAIAADPRNAPAEVARTPRDLAWELQGLTTRLDPEIRFEYVTTTEGEIPAGVCTAIAEAYAEALRNSLRHAAGDRPVSRQVRATIGADRVDVSLLDDGNGFDPAGVSPTRLGIRHGIVGRMAAISGGSATVHSIANYGTTVMLRWVRP